MPAGARLYSYNHVMTHENYSAGVPEDLAGLLEPLLNSFDSLQG